jgi:nucleoside-diphosphate-sugar epimerase
MHTLVTGASGFIGSAVMSRAIQDGRMQVRGTVRQRPSRTSASAETVLVGDLGTDTDWQSALSGIDTVVHTAARAHIMRESSAQPLLEFRRANVEGTLNLARQAAAAGVHRFIFISSIGVNGAESFKRPFTAADPAAPHSPYALSKYEAECGLQQIARDSGMQFVIIRPPLVTGARAPGNFRRLMQCVSRGIPLPLGGIHNLRSIVSVDNLVDLIVTCVAHPNAADEIYLVSDNEDLSTSELLRRLGRSFDRPARLIPVPASILRAGAALMGKTAAAQQLCGSLQVDISKTRTRLGWSPPISVDEGLQRAARGFLECKPSGEQAFMP